MRKTSKFTEEKKEEKKAKKSIQSYRGIVDPISLLDKPGLKTEVEVLYQRMGSKWFAFSLVGDEVFFGSISSEEIRNDEIRKAENGI